MTEPLWKFWEGFTELVCRCLWTSVPWWTSNSYPADHANGGTWALRASPGTCQHLEEPACASRSLLSCRSGRGVVCHRLRARDVLQG